jgi:hypothetical protein
MSPRLSAVLATICFGILIAYVAWDFNWGTPPAAPADPNRLPRTEKEFRDRLAALRMDQDKVRRGIVRLESKKQETVDYLKKSGVSSTADIRGKPDLEYAVRNLEGWNTEIARLRADVSKYDKAISGITTMLDEIERKRISDSVAVSDEDWIRMQSIVVDLDEKLGMDENDIFKDDELNAMLERDLGTPPGDDQKPDG